MPNASPVPGLAAVALVTLASELLARGLVDAQGHARIPAVVLALALGALAAHLLPASGRTALAPGLDVVKKRVLKTAIVLYGLGLTAGNLASVRGPALAIVAICLVVSLLVAAGAGALFGVSRTAKLLIGCGTAICGATAVVTIAPLVDADDDEVAFAVTTIFLFNLVALFAFPWLGHRLGMTDAAFGTWVGTAVNDTSAVVATGRAYSFDAGAIATLVKVIRTLALVPMAMAVGFWASRRGDGGKKVSFAAVFPWFVLGFAVAAALAVTGALPAVLVAPAKLAAGILVTAVLAAVGLHLDARKIAGAGSRSLALGVTIATVMAAVSLGLVRAFGIR